MNIHAFSRISISTFLHLYSCGYPLSQDPGLFNKSIRTKHHKIASPTRLELSPIFQPHSIRHIFRYTPHRLLDWDLSPCHQIPHALIQSNASTNQGICVLNGNFIPLFQLVERDLGVSRINPIRQTREFNAIRDQNTVRRRRSIRDSHDPRMEMDSICNKREIWW